MILQHFLDTGEKVKVTAGKWKGFTGTVVHEFKTGSYRVELDTGLPGQPGKKVILQRDQVEPLVQEKHTQTITNVLIEYRKKGSEGEWFTWVFFNPEEEPGNWVHRKLGRPDTRTTLEFRLVRRTTVITDEVLDTEGE